MAIDKVFPELRRDFDMSFLPRADGRRGFR